MSKKSLGMVGAFLLGFITALPAFAAVPPSILVHSKKAGWTARENWVTQLPRDQMKRMLGLQERPHANDGEFQIQESLSPYFARARQTSSLDWRNKDGVNWVTPILNQGNCGSCVAFASVATLETQVNIASGIPGFNPRFSTQALFACGGAKCEQGWMPADAADYMKSTGVPDEACAPYTMGATGEDVSCGSICSDSDSRSLKIANYNSPSRGNRDIAAVKAALKKGPLVTTLDVYDDFLFYAGGVYKHGTGEAVGGHAVSIVGYDDTARAWIVRNSWGPDWGENGFVRVSYDDVSGVSDSTWSYDIAPTDGYVNLQNPIDRETVSGSAVFKAASTFANTASVDLAVVDGSGRSVISPQSGVPFDTAQLQDGQYDIVANAHYGSGKTSSSNHAIFYVLNKAPALSLQVTNDVLGQPITGRVVVNLDAQTGSKVPFSWLKFHVVNKDGKEIYTKAATIVVEKMTFGWRSAVVADGSYDVFFTGGIDTVDGKSFSTEGQHYSVQVKNTDSSR